MSRERRPDENPVVKLLEEFEKTAWRPVAPPWAEGEKRRQETARRNEELLVAWRRRRIRPAPEEDGAS
ncbi:MAG: hypothetical protein M3R38_27535 [Actinomycetota bacterium]|nr:hypothetical protein [Actinomycetota bacterium]